MKDDPKNRLGDAVLRCAKIAYLSAAPLSDADRAGYLAFLIHQNIPSPACCFYYLDKKHRLLERELVYSGILLSAAECCALLKQGMTRHRASRVFVSFSNENAGMNRENLDWASRISLFCEFDNIPLLDVIWIDEAEYLPVCRFFHNKTT